MAKCILAFSGSLDSLLSIPWVKEHYDMDVVSLSVDLGKETNLEELAERALLSGASSARIEDVRTVFFKDFIGPALKALAHYETYLLASALSRPLVARELVRVALEEGATHVAHASSTKGNDQVRLEAAISVLAPHLEIIAPQREWELKTLEQKKQYARNKRLMVSAPRAKNYRYDLNLWGQSIKCLDFDDPSKAVPEEAYTITRSPLSAPDEPKEVEVEFRSGLPVALNGRRTPPVALIDELNSVAGEHGVGREDLIEDRLVGFKSHEIYEAPAATVLYAAKRALEQMTLVKETLQVREGLSNAYGRMVYNGQYFSELREALDCFYERINKNVTGKVKLRLYKGNVTVISRVSDSSLYSATMVSQDESEELDPQAAKGFTKIWSIPLSAEARRKDKQEEKS